MSDKSFEKAEQNDFVTISSSLIMQEAIELKARLEGNGIHTLMTNSNIASLIPGQELSVGGVRLEVRKSDYEKALDLINASVEESKKAGTYLYTTRSTLIFTGIALSCLFLFHFFWGRKIESNISVALSIAVLFVAIIAGRNLITYRCSEPSCLEKNKKTNTICVRCGREIKGIIKDRNDRLT